MLFRVPDVMKSPLQDPKVLEMQANRPQELSLKEVQTVTEKFKVKIGEGGFGAVYYGTLPNGTTVAVKVRSLNSNQGTREFTTEVSLEIHSNLVSSMETAPLFWFLRLILEIMKILKLKRRRKKPYESRQLNKQIWRGQLLSHCFFLRPKIEILKYNFDQAYLFLNIYFRKLKCKIENKFLDYLDLSPFLYLLLLLLDLIKNLNLSNKQNWRDQHLLSKCLSSSGDLIVR